MKKIVKVLNYDPYGFSEIDSFYRLLILALIQEEIMSRREIREHLFRMLFRKDFHKVDDLNEQIELYFSLLDKPKEKDVEELTNRFNLVIEKLDEIDSIIEEAASGWKLVRLGKVDLTLLRIATYEIKFDEDIPTPVAINEAVEIAKIFGEDNSPSFINGVLAKIA